MAKPFNETEFDMVCTTLQETGSASLHAFSIGSVLQVSDILREAARTLGITPEEYDLSVDGDRATLIVKDKSTDAR